MSYKYILIDEELLEKTGMDVPSVAGIYSAIWDGETLSGMEQVYTNLWFESETDRKNSLYISGDASRIIAMQSVLKQTDFCFVTEENEFAFSSQGKQEIPNCRTIHSHALGTVIQNGSFPGSKRYYK